MLLEVLGVRVAWQVILLQLFGLHNKFLFQVGLHLLRETSIEEGLEEGFLSCNLLRLITLQVPLHEGKVDRRELFLLD